MNPMAKLSLTAKKLMLLSLGVSVCTLVIPLAVYQGDVYELGKYALGLLLGVAATLLRIVLLERSIGKSLDMEPGRAKLYATAQFLLRYAATGGVLVFAALTPQYMNFFGTAAALASLQLAAYLHNHLWKGENTAPSGSHPEE
jgi:hypothetical protein